MAPRRALEVTQCCLSRGTGCHFPQNLSYLMKLYVLCLVIIYHFIISYIILHGPKLLKCCAKSLGEILFGLILEAWPLQPCCKCPEGRDHMEPSESPTALGLGSRNSVSHCQVHYL